MKVLKIGIVNYYFFKYRLQMYNTMCRLQIMLILPNWNNFDIIIQFMFIFKGNP